MDHRKTPLCRFQCKVQSIVAHHSHRSYRYLYRAGTVMGVGKHQIGAYTFPCNDILFWQPCKQPHLSPLLQRSSSFIFYSISKQFIREAESVCILHHFIPVRYHAQHSPVRASHIGFIPLHHFIMFRIHRLLLYRPVKPRKPERFC